MSSFSAISNERLDTCDERLQRVFREVVKSFDCTILEGHRGKDLQDMYFSQGKSKVKWPNGEHNKQPSRAVDAMPYPVDWKDTKRMYFFAGFVLATALSMGVRLRWGGDWDSDKILSDQTFNDCPHYEILEA